MRQGGGHEDVHPATLSVARRPTIYQVLMTATEDIEAELTLTEPELVPLHHEHDLVEIVQEILVKKCCSKCCCLYHCRVNSHHTMFWKKAMEFTNPFMISTMVNIEDESIENDDKRGDIMMEHLNFSEDKLMGDCLTDLLMSVNSNLSGKV